MEKDEKIVTEEDELDQNEAITSSWEVIYNMYFNIYIFLRYFNFKRKILNRLQKTPSQAPLVAHHRNSVSTLSCLTFLRV